MRRIPEPSYSWYKQEVFDQGPWVKDQWPHIVFDWSECLRWLR